MAEFSFDFTGFYGSLTLFLESLFGALGQLFADLAALFNSFTISLT